MYLSEKHRAKVDGSLARFDKEKYKSFYEKKKKKMTITKFEKEHIMR